MLLCPMMTGNCRQDKAGKYNLSISQLPSVTGLPSNPFAAYLFYIVVSHWLDVSLASSSVSILILALRFHLLDWRLRRLLDLGCSHHHRRRCCSCSGSAGWLIGCEAGQMLTLSGGRWRHTRGSFNGRRSSSTSSLIPKFNNSFTTTGITKKGYPRSKR